MATVSIPGGVGNTIQLTFSNEEAATASRQLLAAVAQTLQSGKAVLAVTSVTGGQTFIAPSTNGTPVVADIQAEASGVVVLGDGVPQAIISGSAPVTVLGGSGQNQTYVSTLDDLTLGLQGGSGVVQSTGSHANISVTDKAGGNFQISTQGDGNTVYVGSGNNAVFAGSGKDNIIGLASGNNVAYADGNEFYVAGSGQSTIGTSSGNEVVFGGSGDLTFVNGSGSSTVVGGSGHSTVVGSAGATTLFGGSGEMLAYGGAGDFTLVQGTGSVTVAGGAGSAMLWGGTSGNNILVAGALPSTLVGGGGGDLLFASSAGGDLLEAGSGNETLQGGASKAGNTFLAGSGSDLIGGGSGNDTIFGGSGQDTVVLGSGKSLVALVNGKGNSGTEMLINNFVAGQDQVALVGYGDPATALAQSITMAGSTQIVLQDGTKLVFVGLTNIVRSDFV